MVDTSIVSLIFEMLFSMFDAVPGPVFWTLAYYCLLPALVAGLVVWRDNWSSHA